MILNGVLYVLAITGFLCNSVSCEETTSTTPCNEPTENCYAIAVYNELMKAIEIIKSQTVKNDPRHPRQEDEDDAGILDLDIPSVVPQFFNVVGQVFSFNRSAVAESALEIIPTGLGNRLASVLGRWANGVLGAPVLPPTTTHSPPPKKRKRTTTTSPTTEGSTNSSTSPEPTSTSTEPTTDKGPTTPEVLFKAASLGENPVYASAYAPNYVHTTDYPVYANSFLHILHGIPITSTAPPTTTSTTEPSTSTDPNSYNVDLPFDYMEPTTSIIDSELKSPFFVGPNNGTGSQEEYEYEEGEGTEDSSSVTPGQSRSDSETTTILPPAPQTSSNSSSSLPPTTTATSKNSTTTAPTPGGGKRKEQGPTFDFSQYRLLKDIFFLLQSYY